jgi:hypothetical protein
MPPYRCEGANAGGYSKALRGTGGLLGHRERPLSKVEWHLKQGANRWVRSPR